VLFACGIEAPEAAVEAVATNRKQPASASTASTCQHFTSIGDCAAAINAQQQHTFGASSEAAKRTPATWAFAALDSVVNFATET